MKKILIANRGEIAIRVMKSARKMGIKTVAIYSEVDRNAMHVRFADEAVCVGKATSGESYLVMENVLQAAKDTGADGIHPGYGFLSENAIFAQKVEDAGITFIGPKPHAIRVMGDKLEAKETVKDYDIPMVPGIDEAVTDIELAKEIAVQVGFPVLIKAAAGGGGMVIAAHHRATELKVDLYAHCVELSHMTADLCYINLSAAGVAAHVTQGNTLSMKMGRSFPTPALCTELWHNRLKSNQEPSWL